MDDFERHYASLLSRRVPREEVALGRAYVIHARNGGVGVAVEEDGRLGYRLHREKLGHHYLFVEWDWDEGPPHGTAIPLAPIALSPPADEDELLAWLTARESEHRIEITEAYDELFGVMRSGRAGAAAPAPPAERSEISKRGPSEK